MTGDSSNNKWIGQRTVRPDGADKVTGQAAYAADATMPGMIWGKVLRRPHPHARIRSIDTTKAAALPGVKAVITAADITEIPLDKPLMLGIQDMRWMCRNVMARDKALFAGHPVAAVAATSQKIAADALKLIEVDYEVLPFVIDVDETMAPDAPVKMPISAMVPPTLAAEMDFCRVPGPPTSTTRSTPHPPVSSSTARSQSGVAL